MRALLFIFTFLLTGCALDECHLSGVIELGDGETLEGCRVDGMVVIKGDGVVVRKVVVDASGYQYGIRIMPHSKNVLVELADVSGASISGISASSWPSRTIENVVVRHSVAHHNLGEPSYTDNWSGSGIVLGGVINSRIENCIAYENGELTNSERRNGPVGIWMWDALDSQIVDCESYNNRTRPGHKDGGGFDLDGACENCEIRNCKSWGNDGPGFLVWRYDGAGLSRNNRIINCASYGEKIGLIVGGRDGAESVEVAWSEFVNDIAYQVRPGSQLTIRNSFLCGERQGEAAEKNNTYCEPNN